MSGQRRRYHRTSKPLQYVNNRHPSTFPPTLTNEPFHFFIHMICSTKHLWEEFQPLYGRALLTADKNSKYKHAPIRELAANQPLPQSDLCYLQSSLGLSPSDSLGTAGENFETSQVSVQPWPKGQSISIKLTLKMKEQEMSACLDPCVSPLKAILHLLCVNLYSSSVH